MSQSRTRKVPAAPGDVLRPRAGAKAPGVTNKNPQNQTNHNHHRSKNRIPKSVRYDLENALVGLCDVWFEDIKPHLLRNNIKVHIEREGAGDGDQRGLPTAAPGCSHLDPGAASDRQQRACASCADCYSTQPTVSRAQCRRQRAPPFKLMSPLPSPPIPLTPQSRYPSCDKIAEAPPTPRGRQRRRCRRRAPPPPPPPAPVPRLCRTASMPSRPLSTSNKDKPPARNTRPRRPLLELHIPGCTKLKKRSNMKDKSTQTDKTLLLQGWSLFKNKSPARRKSLSPLRDQRVKTSKYREKSQSPVRRGRHKSLFHQKQTPVSKVPATTNLASRPLQAIPQTQDDIIHMLGKSNNKIIEMLYKSPRKEDYPSAVNLTPTSQRPTSFPKVLPPWR